MSDPIITDTEVEAARERLFNSPLPGILFYLVEGKRAHRGVDYEAGVAIINQVQEHAEDLSALLAAEKARPDADLVMNLRVQLCEAVEEHMQLRTGLQIAEARAEKAEADADAYKNACKRAGVCMSCVLRAPEPYGCTDCLNTGWDGGDPHKQLDQVTAERDVAIADADRLAAALTELNTAMDAFWNDRSRPRLGDGCGSLVKRIADAQTDSSGVLAEHTAARAAPATKPKGGEPNEPERSPDPTHGNTVTAPVADSASAAGARELRDECPCGRLTELCDHPQCEHGGWLDDEPARPAPAPDEALREMARDLMEATWSACLTRSQKEAAILAALTAAVAAERERCAQIAAEFGGPWRGEEIARKIREGRS